VVRNVRYHPTTRLENSTARRSTPVESILKKHAHGSLRRTSGPRPNFCAGGDILIVLVCRLMRRGSRRSLRIFRSNWLSTIPKVSYGIGGEAIACSHHHRIIHEAYVAVSRAPRGGLESKRGRASRVSFRRLKGAHQHRVGGRLFIDSSNRACFARTAAGAVAR
jgi:hypothetical protein